MLHAELIYPNVLRVHYEPHGAQSSRTAVIDPHAHWPGARTSVRTVSGTTVVTSDALIVKLASNPVRIDVESANGKPLLSDGTLQAGGLQFDYAAAGPFYGINTTSLPGLNADRFQDIRVGIYRTGGTVSAGEEGAGAAPLAYTMRYGVLVDSNGGEFSTDDNRLRFRGGSRKDVEFFVIAGDPKALMRRVADISGHAPLMPKWSLGFLNSQWGSSQREVEQIVRRYRALALPIDGFIMDFDWKDWGADDYGEWRWNPKNFPGGPSGAFGREMRAQGIKLSGILKPRILLRTASGSTTQAAAYASAHQLFLREDPYTDYASGRAALDIDFSKAAARSWFWQHLTGAYRTGVAGFWNDEADTAGGNFQFLDMQKGLYDGARSRSSQRVWSLNRNFYLGAQRYAYAAWSGDIETSFDSMREQAIRMLGTVDLGEPHWSMDTGGFDGRPSDENYARWMQMAAFVPIMRVHGTYGQKRQPWLYGAQALADAKAALDLRYELLPYQYAYEWQAHVSGAGIVRPLVWDFPDDAGAPYVTDEWMFGDELLVAPIFGEGQAHRSVYLPKGVWFDYFRGTRYTGPRTLVYRVDPNTWSDIPLFVRSGAIIPSQDVQQYVGQLPVRRIYVDIFPSRARSKFTYYDDDGTTYAYERGVYYLQQIHASRDGAVNVVLDAPQGTFHAPLRDFRLRIHGLAAHAVDVGGHAVSGWRVLRDRFGAVTLIDVPAGSAQNVSAQ